MKTLIIGGTGIVNFDLLENQKPNTVRTPFGGAVVITGTYDGLETGFLMRHGPYHENLAPQVNYRANIWAARDLGFNRILGISAVASLVPPIKVGDLVLLDQLVDMTHDRESTFFPGSVKMTEPFCSHMRTIIVQTASQENVFIHPQATYICFNGPRYETAAEIRLFQHWGMDVVGMTNATEATLCREVGLCYSTIALVTNMGAGLSKDGPDLQRHRQVTQQNLPKLRQITFACLPALSQQQACTCCD